MMNLNEIVAKWNAENVPLAERLRQALVEIEKLRQEPLNLGEPGWRDGYAAQQDGAWQPIETAPKDGREILLWWRTGKKPAIGRWECDEAFGEEHKGQTIEEGWRCEGDQCIPYNQKDCTHWQPLPAGPEQNRSTT